MPGGRPVEFIEQKKLVYVALLRQGVGRRAACSNRDVDVNYKTVVAHRKSDPDFREACEQAEAEANQPVIQALYEAASRGEAWAVKMWLNNRDSGNWQEKVDVQVSGEVAHTAPGIGAVLELQAELERRRLELGPGSAGPDTGEYPVIDVESEEAG